MNQEQQERLMHVLISPMVTEKAQAGVDGGRVVFEVRRDANKFEIKRAVETLFKVEVEAVRTCITMGKAKIHKGKRGKRSDWKKAYVTLKSGHEINFGVTGA
jgi:large subunit ribosomal protein L23